MIQLLGQDRVVRKRRREAIHDDRLRAGVHLGYQVGRAALELDATGAAPLVVEQIAHLARQRDGQLPLDRQV
jgi:class 3 adenylate cyclase